MRITPARTGETADHMDRDKYLIRRRNMKHQTKKTVSFWLAIVLCLCMALSVPGNVAYAAPAQDGLCEHHKEHTQECGYQESEGGESCTHVHDEECGYAEEAAGSPCQYVCDICNGTNSEGSDADGGSGDEPSAQSDDIADQTPRAAGTYEVSNGEELTQALKDIAGAPEQDAAIVLTADVAAERRTLTSEETALIGGENPGAVNVMGVAGKHITFTSDENGRHRISNLGSYLVGDVTFDNVTYNAGSDVFANGFLLEFTEKFDGGIKAYVYGGSNRRSVESTHLIFNAGSFGNPNSSYFIYGGGYSGGMGTATGPSLGLDGEDGMPGWTPPEFKAGTGDVSGDVTIEIGGTAVLTALIGGSRNGNVGGNVTITVQADSADTRTVDWIRGAGYANQKGYGHVMGDVTINAISGQTFGISGTGYGGRPSGCEVGDANSVAGDVTINVGQESGTAMYLKGTGGYLIGCGEDLTGGNSGNLGHTVCGDVTITLNQTAKMDDGDGANTYNQSVYGVYTSSIVRGNVTVINNGAEALFNMCGAYDGARIMGAECDYALKMVMNGGHLRKTQTSYGSMFAANRKYGTETKPAIDGDVKMEFNDGYIWGITPENGLATIDGDVEVTVRGGTIYGGIDGGKAGNSLTEGHTATLIFDGCKSARNKTVPYARYFDEVRVTNNSSVIISAKDGAGTAIDQPFYDNSGVKDLTIDAGSALALAKDAQITGDLTVNGTLALPRSTGSVTTLTAGGTAGGNGKLQPVNPTFLSSFGTLFWSQPVLNEEYVYAKAENSDMELALSQDAGSLFVDRKESAAQGQDVWFINEEQEQEQLWYFEVYYQYYNEDGAETDENGRSYDWIDWKHGQGGWALPGQTVTISHERWDNQELDWEDLSGTGNEILGVHYVYDEDYGPHRLSASCREATSSNPLKIYYRAALNDVVYEYKGDVPEGADALLPGAEKAPYGCQVDIAENPVLPGYTFSGWTIEAPDYMEANGLIGNGEFTMPNETVKLTGSWTKTESVLLTPQDMVAYTGGDSISEDNFPSVRYKIDTPSGVNPEDIELFADGQKCELEEVGEGGYYLLSDVENTFIHQDQSSSTGGAAENDAVAGIYDIGVADESSLTAQKSGSGEKMTVQVADAGTLTVRNVSEPEEVINETLDVAQQVVTDSEDVNTDDGIGMAVIPEGTEFYTNGDEALGVLGDAESEEPQISLLFDDILPGEEGEDTSRLLMDRAAEDGYELTENNSEFRYLDLINENDGNAWMSAEDGSTITIYWPCPDGVTAAEYEAEVLHFKGLHREYRDDMEEQVQNSEIEKISAVIKDGNIVFTLTGDQEQGSFSPFAIHWQKNNEQKPPAGPDGNGTQPDVSGGDSSGNKTDKAEQKSDNAPQTGVSANIAPWLALIGISGAGAAGTVIYRKREQKKKKYRG